MARLPSRRTVLALVTLAASAVAAGALAVDSAASSAPLIVDVRIRYSHYEPSLVTVPGGRPITFVLVNDAPIDHEWILGDAAVHERHRTGNEPYHASRPTEVSIDA